MTPRSECDQVAHATTSLPYCSRCGGTFFSHVFEATVVMNIDSPLASDELGDPIEPYRIELPFFDSFETPEFIDRRNGRVRCEECDAQVASEEITELIVAPVWTLGMSVRLPTGDLATVEAIYCTAGDPKFITAGGADYQPWELQPLSAQETAAGDAIAPR
jgi:hypothetical protein